MINSLISGDIKSRVRRKTFEIWRECIFDAGAYRFANKSPDTMRCAAMTKHRECLSVICTGTSCPPSLHVQIMSCEMECSCFF